MQPFLVVVLHQLRDDRFRPQAVAAVGTKCLTCGPLRCPQWAVHAAGELGGLKRQGVDALRSAHRFAREGTFARNRAHCAVGKSSVRVRCARTADRTNLNGGVPPGAAWSIRRPLFASGSSAAASWCPIDWCSVTGASCLLEISLPAVGCGPPRVGLPGSRCTNCHLTAPQGQLHMCHRST
jgi:hypothetical protein